MGKKNWLSMHPRNFGSDKIVPTYVCTSTPSCKLGWNCAFRAPRAFRRKLHGRPDFKREREKKKFCKAESFFRLTAFSQEFKFGSKDQSYQKEGTDADKGSNQPSVEILNKRSKADFTAGNIYYFATNILEGTTFLLQGLTYNDRRALVRAKSSQWSTTLGNKIW